MFFYTQMTALMFMSIDSVSRIIFSRQWNSFGVCLCPVLLFEIAKQVTFSWGMIRLPPRPKRQNVKSVLSFFWKNIKRFCRLHLLWKKRLVSFCQHIQSFQFWVQRDLWYTLRVFKMFRSFASRKIVWLRKHLSQS